MCVVCVHVPRNVSLIFISLQLFLKMDDVEFMLGLISEKITEGAERQTGRETGMLGLEVVVTLHCCFHFHFILSSTSFHTQVKGVPT